MRFAVFFSLFFAACSAAIETGHVVEPNVEGAPSNTSVLVKPTPLPRPVFPKARLTKKQQNNLDKSIPAEVRKFFEDADELVLLAEVYPDNVHDDSRELTPNRVVVIADRKQRKEILDSFYFDAAHEEYPAICFDPHHSLRATKSGKVLEIEICFDCSRFEGSGSLQSVSGTIVREGRRSESLFDWLIANHGSEYKK